MSAAIPLQSKKSVWLIIENDKENIRSVLWVLFIALILLCLHHPTVSRKALCFWAVHSPPSLSVRSYDQMWLSTISR